MIIKISSFYGTHDKQFQDAIDIRFKVFSEEQNVDKSIDYDGLDFESSHFLIIVDDVPVGTARYRETHEGIKIERLAVLKKYRSFGYANLLMRFILNELKNAKLKIYLHAQIQTTEFYNSLGFKQEGNIFKEANIEHAKMVYNK